MILVDVIHIVSAATLMTPPPLPTSPPSPDTLQSIAPHLIGPSAVATTTATANANSSASGDITPTSLLTVVVAVVTGVLSALGTAWVQNLRAKHERRSARLAALWNYHRVLTGVSASVDKFYGEDMELYGEGAVDSQFATARNDAYPHFHVFPKEDQGRLRYPTIADYSQPGELKDHVDKAIRVLEAYLEKNSKE
ncbi:hypothetical protein [Arthrobacter sp. FW306-04-A]|uniref:hypothetical protein n=1 Tax=Arthrobacter sp. FW306-04-A TaxID=2879619 RepID=UPI0037C13DED|nr:hypothetical protein LFT43_15735 [Arthrobacter sp. FW306-04-A]